MTLVILKALKQSGQADNTIVIFTGVDNGPEGYAYKRDETFDHWSAEPFRGLKRDIYEGGIMCLLSSNGQESPRREVPVISWSLQIDFMVH